MSFRVRRGMNLSVENVQRGDLTIDGWQKAFTENGLFAVQTPREDKSNGAEGQ